jgi:hypothetical protein
MFKAALKWWYCSLPVHVRVKTRATPQHIGARRDAYRIDGSYALRHPILDADPDVTLVTLLSRDC